MKNNKNSSLILGFCKCKECGAEYFVWNSYFCCKYCGSKKYENTSLKYDEEVSEDER